MKIAYIVERFHTNLYPRVKALQMAGHEVFVLAKYAKGQERYDLIKPIILKKPLGSAFWEFLARHSSVIYFDIPSPLDLRQKLIEISPDVIIARNLNSLRTIFAFLFARKKVKYIFAEAQTPNYDLGGGLKNSLVKWFLKFIGAKGIITPLKNRSNNKGEVFKYLPFAVEIENFEKKYFKNDRVNIIMVGKFFPRKEHLLLLEVVKELKEKYPIFLTIIGQKADNDDYYNQVVNYIKENKLEEFVEIKTNLENVQVLELYRQQDVFVLPAHSEPASHSVLEAMAAKLPVIASTTCGTSCYIEEGGNGFVFKSGDKNDLKEKLEQLVSDNIKIENFGAKSFKLTTQNHSLEVFARGLEKIIAE